MNWIDLSLLPSSSEFDVLADEEARLLLTARNRRFDIEEFVEEIEHVGGSERREIRNRMAVLLAHLLKWEFQPDRRSNSWRATVTEQRSEIAAVIRRNPSLKSSPETAIASVYKAAAMKASKEIGLSLSHMPATCSYGVSDILDHQFWPGPT